MAAAKKAAATATVKALCLNLREQPSEDATILARLPHGLKLTIDGGREAPDGWLAIDGVGYVMAEFVK